MSIGSMRQRILFQQRSPGVDALGQPSTTWLTVCEVWAEITALAGRELTVGRLERAESSTRLVVRYRSGLSTAMRVQHGANFYDITEISDLDGRKRYLQIMCKAGLSNG